MNLVVNFMVAYGAKTEAKTSQILQIMALMRDNCRQIDIVFYINRHRVQILHDFMSYQKKKYPPHI